MTIFDSLIAELRRQQGYPDSVEFLISPRSDGKTVIIHGAIDLVALAGVVGEECAKLVENTGLRNHDNIARDIRRLSGAKP